MAIANWASARLGIDQKGSKVFRRQRFRIFLDLIDEALSRRDVCRILDIGGEVEYWTMVSDLIGDRNIYVTLVNLTAPAVDSSRFSSLAGDARDLSSLADMSFDLVHSNSVIEHVGRWRDMLAMAQEVRRLAPAYYVQTPYFWFPIEPHCSTAFFHWLPEPVRLSMLLRRPRGHWGMAPDVSSAMGQIQSADLLDVRTMSALFPDATIQREKVAGLTKSLIAIRHAADMHASGPGVDALAMPSRGQGEAANRSVALASA